MRSKYFSAISKGIVARIEVEIADGRMQAEVNSLALQARQEVDLDMIPAAVRACNRSQQFSDAEQQKGQRADRTITY